MPASRVPPVQRGKRPEGAGSTLRYGRFPSHNPTSNFDAEIYTHTHTQFVKYFFRLWRVLHSSARWVTDRGLEPSAPRAQLSGSRGPPSRASRFRGEERTAKVRRARRQGRSFTGRAPEGLLVRSCCAHTPGRKARRLRLA